MESMYQVFQYNFGLHGHTFVEGFLTHVAVYHSLLTERTEVGITPVSYTHLRAHETVLDLVCRLLLEKKKPSN